MSSNKKILFLVKEDYKIVSYGTSLYELYEELSFDPLLSLVGLLKSTGKITLGPEELSKQAFSQIYLVFDYEPHYQKYSDEKVKKMLSFFDNETENGKLYINYPMFEAAFYLDDFENPKCAYEKISIIDCCGETFKPKVRSLSCFGTKNHLDFSLSKTLDIWQSIKWNYKRVVYLIGKEELDYQMVLDRQIEIKNSKEKSILILSTFVLLIVDYNPGILKVLEELIGL